MKPRIPKKYQPRGYEILYEDRDLLVGNKAAGFVTVEAKWSRGDTIQDAVSNYLRKGNPRARNVAYVVHRLDQATTGVLMFAKSEKAQFFLKENWPTTVKTYFAVVRGILQNKAGTISSYLVEDDDYVVHSSQDREGKLSRTEYEVVQETGLLSLLKINLLTGRKNQIRVHMSEAGHPLVGDTKYGGPETRSALKSEARSKNLALHAASIVFTHPHSGERITVTAPIPDHFRKLVRIDPALC